MHRTGEGSAASGAAIRWRGARCCDGLWADQRARAQGALFAVPMSFLELVVQPFQPPARTRWRPQPARMLYSQSVEPQTKLESPFVLRLTSSSKGKKPAVRLAWAEREREEVSL